MDLHNLGSVHLTSTALVRVSHPNPNPNPNPNQVHLTSTALAALRHSVAIDQRHYPGRCST